jgi:L-iditol 2-dehydrogenase
MNDPASIAPQANRSTMRAQMLHRPGEMELVTVPRPTAGPGEVVLRVRAALTCGTDVKTFLRGHPIFPTPTLFGHEFAGEITEVGRGCRAFEEGAAVMAVPTAPCGECYLCRHGDENLCDAIKRDYVVGGFGEYVKLPARVVAANVFAKPASLAFAEAALLEPLSCVVHGLEMVPLQPDSTVVLIGAGAISLLHFLAVRALGIARVIVAGRGERRLAQARQIGVPHVVAGGVEHARAAILDLTEGRGADVVIECTGQVAVWEAAPHLVRRGGWVILFGGCPVGTQASFATERLHYDQIRLVSPFHFRPRAVRRAYELLASGAVDGSGLISGVFPLEELPAALEKHRRGDGIKYAVVP